MIQSLFIASTSGHADLLNFNSAINDEITQISVSDWENNEEIQILREYLRIPTVHPDIIYSKVFG